MNIELKRLFAPWVLLASLFVTGLLLLLTFLWVQWSAPAAPDVSGLLAAVTDIPVPTRTPAPFVTPTVDPYIATPTPTFAPGEFGIGSFVQITGTQGEGLRIRSEPGLNGKQLFLGFDTEAYTVLDGPRSVDGYEWYFLAAVNDQTRTGWAASDFITRIINP